MKHEIVVLVVDNREIYDYMAPVIREELHAARVLHRETIAGALELIYSEMVIDFIFCDWEVAGAEFVRAVRRDPENHHTPLVVMTESDADEIIANAIRVGASDVLSKPFLTNALRNKIRSVARNEERRFLRRVRADHDVSVRVRFDGVEPLDLEVIDLSIAGCRVRGPLSLCGRLCIYSRCGLTLRFNEAQMGLVGQLIRLDYDPLGPEPGATILLAFHFDEMDDGLRERMRDTLDALRELHAPE